MGMEHMSRSEIVFGEVINRYAGKNSLLFGNIFFKLLIKYCILLLKYHLNLNSNYCNYQ